MFDKSNETATTKSCTSPDMRWIGFERDLYEVAICYAPKCDRFVHVCAVFVGMCWVSEEAVEALSNIIKWTN